MACERVLRRQATKNMASEVREDFRGKRQKSKDVILGIAANRAASEWLRLRQLQKAICGEGRVVSR